MARRGSSGSTWFAFVASVTYVLTGPGLQRGLQGVKLSGDCAAYSSHGVPPRIAAISIFRIVIIASKARLAAAGSGSRIASVSASGAICHDNPHLSMRQPQALFSPPLPTIAFQ